MTGDREPDRRGTWAIRIGQLLLVFSAGALWVASALPWVVIRSFDTLGKPRTTTLSGASWSTALVPLALLLLAAAIAALAVRGAMLRLLAVLVAMVCLGTGYLAISQWAVPDVAVRAADLAQIPLRFLVESDRRYWGAAITLVATACALAGAVLLMRSATFGGAGTTKYVTPSARRATTSSDDRKAGDGGQDDRVDWVDQGKMSERMIWDALDEGNDPTDRPPGSKGLAQPESDCESDKEGR